MTNDDLNNLANHNILVNKPTEETYGEATVSSDVFQHATNEEVTMDDIQVNSLIDMFAQMYTEKWSSALNLKYREGKTGDIRDFIANNNLSIEDMKNYINWLFRGRLNKKFPGNLGCLHSQSMFDEWKGKEITSVGTSNEKFVAIRDNTLSKNSNISRNFKLFNSKATSEEKVEYDKYFSFEYDGDDAMAWWNATLAKCKLR